MTATARILRPFILMNPFRGVSRREESLRHVGAAAPRAVRASRGEAAAARRAAPAAGRRPSKAENATRHNDGPLATAASRDGGPFASWAFHTAGGGRPTRGPTWSALALC